MPLPTVVETYIQAAMKCASFEHIDGIVAATVPGAFGVMAFGATKRDCLDDLRARLEEWVAVSLADGIALPAFGGISFSGADKEALTESNHRRLEATGRASFASEEEFLAALARWDQDDPSS